LDIVDYFKKSILEIRDLISDGYDKSLPVAFQNLVNGPIVAAGWPFVREVIATGVTIAKFMAKSLVVTTIHNFKAEFISTVLEVKAYVEIKMAPVIEYISYKLAPIYNAIIKYRTKII